MILYSHLSPVISHRRPCGDSYETGIACRVAVSIAGSDRYLCTVGIYDSQKPN